MKEIEKILADLKDEFETEILFGPQQQVGELILIPIYELIVFGAGFNKEIQGGGGCLQPISLVVINKKEKISLFPIKSDDCYKKNEDNQR